MVKGAMAPELEARQAGTNFRPAFSPIVRESIIQPVVEPRQSGLGVPQGNAELALAAMLEAQREQLELAERRRRRALAAPSSNITFTNVGRGVHVLPAMSNTRSLRLGGLG